MREEQGLIIAILILIVLFVAYILYMNYNNQKSINKDINQEDEKVIDKGAHWSPQSLESYVTLVTTAGELFSNYINTMNVNVVPIFEKMNKQSSFQHYIKYVNKATNYINSIINNITLLNNELQKPVINNVLVNNLVYNVKHNIKDLYQQINYAQFEMLCAFKYAMKYGYQIHIY
jgi:hypothetical protein